METGFKAYLMGPSEADQTVSWLSRVQGQGDCRQMSTEASASGAGAQDSQCHMPSRSMEPAPVERLERVQRA